MRRQAEDAPRNCVGFLQCSQERSDADADEGDGDEADVDEGEGNAWRTDISNRKRLPTDAFDSELLNLDVLSKAVPDLRRELPMLGRGY